MQFKPGQILAAWLGFLPQVATNIGVLPERFLLRTGIYLLHSTIEDGYIYYLFMLILLYTKD